MSLTNDERNTHDSVVVTCLIFALSTLYNISKIPPEILLVIS